MELTVLDTNLLSVGVLDVFDSGIWTDRYCGFGDFEVYTAVNQKALTLLQTDYYLLQKESEHIMVIEDRKIKSDIENGDQFIVTGRSLESILDRRIVWEQTILTGDFQTGIQKLFNDNIINPVIADRKIDNFIFERSTDPIITALKIDAQFTRTNLYDTITKLCSANNIGFKITVSDNKQFVFKLYAGSDRTYDQFNNPYVVFSPRSENIVNSNYSESRKTLKTVTVVAGEGQGLDRKAAILGGGASLARRELYTDARDLSQTVDDVVLTDAAYLAQLVQRGTEALTSYIVEKSFDSQVDDSTMYKYGKDFFMGDIVQIDNGYGIQATARVTELIHSQSTSGDLIYPTFNMVNATNVTPNGGITVVSGGGSSEDAMHRTVTDAEKIAWNGKAPGGFGLGTTATLVTGDANNLKTTGFYRGDSLTNGPTIGLVPTSGWFFYEVIGHDTNWVKQQATSFGTGMGPNRIFNRVLVNNVWSDWSELLVYRKLTAVQLNDPNLPSGIYNNNGDGLLNPSGVLQIAGWFHIIVLYHFGNNGYGAQIATGLTAPGMYVRSAFGGAWQPWEKITTAVA